MVRTQIYLPEDLFAQLKLISTNSKLKFSDLVREGVKKVIDDRKPKFNKKAWLTKYFGAIKTKVKTNAVQDIHDYYLNFK